MTLPEDAAYALESAQERERRHKWLRFPHMQPLTQYLSVLREDRGEGYHIPNFDPCDGGINAKAMFILEAPGPKAVDVGFISRNNPDQTAKNLLETMELAAIPRTVTLMWNVVPWYVGEEDRSRIRAVKRDDVQEALPYLRILIGLLTNLKVIVLCGQKAQSVTAAIRTFSNALIVPTHHTSPLVFNSSLDKKREVQETFLRVAQIIKEA